MNDFIAVYMARNNEYLFFRIDVAEIINMYGEMDFGFIIKFKNNIGVNLEYSADLEFILLWIRDYNYSTNDVLYSYPSSYASIGERIFEFKIELNDIENYVDLNNTFLRGEAFDNDFVTVDDTDMVYYPNITTTTTTASNTTSIPPDNNSNIPFADITIDGDFSDWDDVPVAVEDPEGDNNNNLPMNDSIAVYLAKNNEYLFFRIDVAEILDDGGMSFGFDIIFNASIYVNLVYSADLILGQLLLLDRRDPNNSLIKSYSSFFASFGDSSFEYKVALQDIENYVDLNNTFFRGEALDNDFLTVDDTDIRLSHPILLQHLLQE